MGSLAGNQCFASSNSSISDNTHNGTFLAKKEDLCGAGKPES
jgi:hypothetical protein